MSLLRDLYRLGRSLDDRILPEGFRRSHVDLVIHLGLDGSVNEIVIERDMRLGQRVVPDSSRTSGNQAHLAADKLEYVTAWGSSTTGDRAWLRHQNFLALLGEAIEAIDGDGRELLQAVALAAEDRDALEGRVRSTVGTEPAEGWTILGGWTVDFVVDDRRLFGVPGEGFGNIMRWWTSQQRQANAADGPDIVCQISDLPGAAARLFPSTKLPGNQPRLVAANFPSAYRYGAEQATGSGVTLEGASVATRAINWLLTTDEDLHRARLGEAVAVAWLPDDLDLGVLHWFVEPSPVDVVNLVAREIWTGRPHLNEKSKVVLAVLSVNSARVVVQADHTTSLAGLQRRVRTWWEAMAPVMQQNPRAPLGLYHLAAGVVGADAIRRPSKNAALDKALTRAATSLFRSAVLGAALPVSVRNQTIDRCGRGSVDRNGRRTHVTDAQAAVLYQYASTRRESAMTNEAAAICGRILAELERIQEDAIGEVGNGVSQSYAAASSTPQLAFGRLMAARPAHLRKLKRDKPGMAVRSDQRMNELMAALLDAGGFPRFLDYAGRSSFALGYYDQRHLRYQKSDVSENILVQLEGAE